MKNKNNLAIFTLILSQFLLAPLTYAQVSADPTMQNLENISPTPNIPHSTPQEISTPNVTSDTTTQPEVLGLQTPAVPPIITAIKNAKVLLSSVTLNHALSPVYKKNTKTLLRYNLGDKDIALAILDPATNNTIVTMGRLNGKKMVFPDPAVDVKLTKFNGVNSKFQVNVPANGTVVALKYLLSKTESGSRAAIERGLSEALYVPSSPALGQPDVIAYGQKYLDSIIAKVVKDLYGLPSQAIPGVTVTEAIPPAMIKSLVYAEHTDTGSVMNGNAQGALDSLNIIFATNEGDAYKYSVSNDGFASRGIAQFVKSTYDSLVNRHPEAFLMQDYVLGMEDHQNSIKAMYLLLDDYAGAVRVKAADGFVASRVFDYGAASYNAGTSRVAAAVKNYGSNWSADRSGQINALQGQVTSYKRQVTSLKAQIKKTSDAKAKASLQSQLATANANLAASTDELSTMQASTLRNATVNYLTKIYKVIQYFNEQHLAMN